MSKSQHIAGIRAKPDSVRRPTACGQTAGENRLHLFVTNQNHFQLAMLAYNPQRMADAVQS
jgi:hypothetical protein